MQILLCGLPEAVEAVVRRTLVGGDHALTSAPDAAEALRAMVTGGPAAIVVVGANARQSLFDACRQLRAAEICRDALIVAANANPDDVSALIQAGADDFFVETPGDGIVRGRLLVAMRAADARIARRAAERDLKQFFQLSLDLFCIAGLDGYFKLLNPAWTRTLGWSIAELLAQPWLDFVHPDDRQLTLDAGSQLAEGRAVIDFTNRYRCKDGSYRWLQWQSAPLVERGLIYCAVHDVTDARADKEALRELSVSLATTLHSIGDGVIATDLTGAVIRMNPIAEQITGWTLDEARGRPVTELLQLLDEETRGKVENPIERALREGVIVTLHKHTLLKRRDGSEIAIADSCAPIKSSAGAVNGAVLVFRDLTDERAAELKQARFQQQLVFADRMASVGTLAAGVAHEINNPLSYVTANVDLAIEEIRGTDHGGSSGRMKEVEDMLTEAREGISRVTKIVRGLKTFSRIEEERAAVIDLVPVIELSINMSFNEIRHRARLVKDYGRLPLVEADDARLSQVFINLLVNAAHALPEGNTEANEIRIVTSTDERGRAVVEVRDTGPGIPPALLGRIFEPFFTTKPVGLGTGLGLAISHNIVTGMGGEISVQSVVGRGSVFRVALPPSLSPELAAPLIKRRARPMPARSARVLVVDDEPSIGMAVRRVLRGHDVTVLMSAQDALDLLATGKEFDVVLSDLMMPGISGMELYRTLVVQHPKIASRVVFVTGGAFTLEANTFLDQIVNERLEKPFDPHRLREMVEKFVR